MEYIKEKIKFHSKEEKELLITLLKAYNLTSSIYIRSMILIDLQKILKRHLTEKDLLHGFDIQVGDE